MMARLLALFLLSYSGMALAEPGKVLQAERELSAHPQHQPGQPSVVVEISRQRLYLYENGRLQAEYPVSTSSYGIGSQAGSNKTPLGIHRVAKRFGEGAPLGMIFKARRPTGRIAEILTEPVDVPEDHVTTRVLWLEGLEEGKNRGPGIDSFKRYIYIHGTPEEGLIGAPASHGCVRMLNRDVIELFDRLPVASLVAIIE